MNSHAYDPEHARSTSRSSPALASWYTQGRSDGLGDRLLMTDNTGAESLELLRFHAPLTGAFGFERALREQVERLDRFQHAAFARVRAVEYLEDGDGLALVATHIAGTRLSDMFRSPRLRPALNPAFATWLVRQLTSAIAELQAQGKGIAHGLLTPDRVVLTPERRVVVLEHVLAPAIEGLNLTPNRLWSELGVMTTPSQGAIVRLDARNDVVQIGLMVLAVVLGRRVGPDEYPAKLTALLEEFAVSAHPFALVEPLRLWVERALRVDGNGFRNAREARDGLGELPGDVASKQLDDDVSARQPSPVPGTLPPLRVSDDAARVPLPPAAGESARKNGIIVPIYAMDPADELSPFERNQPMPAAARPKATARRRKLSLTQALAIAAVLEAVAIAGLVYTRPHAGRAASLPLKIDSNSAGDLVLIDGRRVGVTPFGGTVGAGTRTITVLHPETIAAAPIPAVPPPPADTAPAVTVKPAADARANALIEQAAAKQRSGGLKLISPIELQVLEGEHVLGSTVDGPIIASAGVHELDIVNNALGYRSRQTVTVKAGQIIALTINPPGGRLSANAQPWAQVLVDGNVVGETPIANLSIPLGEHEIVFRNPQFGDRREKVMVRSGSVTRVSAILGR